MNVSVGDFIPGAGQHYDLLDRVRRRMDVYRQRHVELANNFDGRHNEIAERLRLETAAYHKRWMESKAKRTTSKSKAGPKGEGSSMNPNTYAKLKRKSNSDDTALASKTLRPVDTNTDYVYNFDDPTGLDVSTQGQGKNSPQNRRCVAESFHTQPFPGNPTLNIGMETNDNSPNNDVKNRFTGSVGAKPEASTTAEAFDNADLCKKEPNDDADLVNGDDDGLYDWLKEIGQEGEEDLPADLLQMFDQGEFGNMDSSLTMKDSVSNCTTEQTTGNSTSVTSALAYIDSIDSDFKISGTSTSNGSKPQGQCSTSGGSQMTLNVDMGQTLVNDAGPAAETLKQMAARRSYSTEALGYPQKRQQMSVESYNYSIPYPVTDYASSSSLSTTSSSGMATLQSAHLYSAPFSMNSANSQLPALRSCSEKLEQDTTHCQTSPMNPYTMDVGFSGNKQIYGQSPSSCGAFPASVKHSAVTGDPPPGLYHSLQSQKSQLDSSVQLSMHPNQQTVVSDASQFGCGQSDLAIHQRLQYSDRPSQGFNSAHDSYLQAAVRSSNGNPNNHMRYNISPHHFTSYVPSMSRIQTGGQMIIKPTGPDPQQCEMSFVGSGNIKVEAGITGCSQTNNKAYPDSASPTVQKFGNNQSRCGYFGMGYTQQGGQLNALSSAQMTRPNVPQYFRDCHMRTSNKGHMDALTYQIQSGNWMQTTTVQSSLVMRQDPSSNVSFCGSTVATGQYPRCRSMNSQIASTCHTNQKQQQAMRLPTRGWSYMETKPSLEYLQTSIDQTQLTADISHHGLPRQNSASGSVSAVPCVPSGQHLGIGVMQEHQLPTSGHWQSSMPCGSNNTTTLYDSSTNQNATQLSVDLSLINDFINVYKSE